jgi:hypothetical protein
MSSLLFLTLVFAWYLLQALQASLSSFYPLKVDALRFFGLYAFALQFAKTFLRFEA